MHNKLSSKRTILVVSPDTGVQDLYKFLVQNHFLECSVYVSSDGSDAILKIENDHPDIVIMDYDLKKVSGQQLVEYILKIPDLERTAIIIFNEQLAKQRYLDEIVSGKIQLLIKDKDEDEIINSLMRAMNFVAQGDNREFKLKYLAANDLLIRVNEKADHVYILRKGKLRAYIHKDNHEVTLGTIEPGEFVGEMAYIDGQNRNANVIAESACELIEIPLGILDSILYNKPSWSKALMNTLSKRIKILNKLKSKTN